MDGFIAMLPPALRRWSTHHDFEGQKLAEKIFQTIMIIAGVVGFCVGTSTQQLSHAIYIVLGGAVLSALVVLPPWPFLFRQHPVVWQPVGADATSAGAAPVAKETRKKK
ncbi:hypothetical protein WR25_08224 [Diploscapter pachys]|uniref:Signal peptidase complex subunit 1 n=1 Tax=Diploscapter pachys TaxID=2018661 RepID=A0A2A2LHI4_9BILA|nr:hypothetical protein WR25_08224 [Diploscapter pachys]